ncbi:hypothetical protein J8M21_25490 [Pseudoalteromonas luteoviolacea]|uniref:hypothetical protein n=1 Tax=Pseudoalteromonas luteoviolacea TaxID=43657 RepID=UPI001B3A3711|nr:hypothetical protein [Pseudoalteromonas luteoviolacea]MBQ4880556.1 hypothetical protein [Pseudoalteromonas luteoviolacea]MBQ4909598.1 hypothetical protein [Pseudoalteromonas luteoviolacea]
MITSTNHLNDARAMSITADGQIAEQLFQHYHEKLLGMPKVLELLRSQGIDDAQIFHKYMGYSDRSLNKVLPGARTALGGFVRGRLQAMQLLRKSGHEVFAGCVVEPCFDLNGMVCSACGVRFRRQASRARPRMVFWYRAGIYYAPFEFLLPKMGGYYA